MNGLKLKIPAKLSAKVSAIWAAVALSAAGGCKNNTGPQQQPGPNATSAGGIVPTGTLETQSPTTTDTEPTGPDFTLPESDGTTTTDDRPPNPACYGVPDCYPIDLLFVIDNSGTMGEEQENLARNFKGLIDQLWDLKDGDGNPVVPSINLMVTTSDVGHPVCVEEVKDKPNFDYVPALGKPVATACTSRLKDFTGRKEGSASQEQACTNTCKESGFLPSPQPFIHFGAKGQPTNIPMDRVIDAINCMGPQGINGCGYEAPLEAMRYALDPSQEWNKGDRPFLRKGAYLAVAIVTDEADCSVHSVDNGFKYFSLSDTQFWETDPSSGTKEVSSAVCWNGGVDCTTDATGKRSCKSKDTGVLYPVSRYVNQLKSYVQADKEVVMLGILGVPEVTAHNPKPPFQPTAGGVYDLQYRDWKDVPPEWVPAGSSADALQWEFGVGPGCSRANTGQAVPPVRIKEVCESLNRVDDGEAQVRCCIESICDDDFSNAMRCLSGLIRNIPPPK